MSFKLRRFLTDPYYMGYTLAKPFARHISDKSFVRWKFRMQFHRELDLDNPQTYSEKLQWLKLYGRRADYAPLVDKVEAKRLVGAMIGEEHIVPTLGVWERFADIDFNALPERFVLKCTHNSHCLVVCSDKARFSIASAQRKLTRGLRRNPFWTNREYPYKDVPPRLIAEQYLEQAGGEPLRDYKVFCFNGKARLIQLHQNRFSAHTLDFYDTAWKRTAMARPRVPRAETDAPRPEHLEEMLRLSEQLTTGMPHCRVDWYDVQGHLYFGEMTFFPASGLAAFASEADDLLLGSWLQLPEKE